MFSLELRELLEFSKKKGKKRKEKKKKEGCSKHAQQAVENFFEIKVRYQLIKISAKPNSEDAYGNTLVNN